MATDLSPNGSDGEMGPISAINVTPFVDVVLVLLVIFMVTAPALMKDAIGLKLPKSASSDVKHAISPLGIAVTKQGTILVNGQLADPASVTTQVKAALQANPDAQALISADADARHGDVVRAIDLVKSAGLSRFAIQIERP
jgi:biopolymer transport protein ExbD